MLKLLKVKYWIQAIENYNDLFYGLSHIWLIVDIISHYPYFQMVYPLKGSSVPLVYPLKGSSVKIHNGSYF